MLCLFAISFLTSMSFAQNITTWHNDNNRTGWQQNETTLYATGTGHVSQSNFGLLWKWPVDGYVFAQPLAVTLLQTVGSCANPCSLVFVATEQDMLYAFNASSSSSTPIWSLDLAGYIGGTYLTCTSTSDDPCSQGVLGPYEGVTGTPVIDMGATPHPTLYVAAAVNIGGAKNYYLYAIDITTGLPRGIPQNNPVQIAATVTGQQPSTTCISDYPGNGGTVSFDYLHPQRSGLLLLNGKVYVAFASGNGEHNNGWIFGYPFNFANNTFSPPVIFNSTLYGTGGGFWGSGAGLTSDGTSIYAAAANGTFDLYNANPSAVDAGDTLLKLNPSNLAILSYYTPFNVFSYDNGTGLCGDDEDFGSGGVLVVPSPFTYGSQSILITADKQSNVYVSNQSSLGGFNSNGGNNVQTLLTPNDGHGNKLAPSQGYWASPAYWHYNDGQDHYMLYYSATTETDQDKARAPYPINGYQLVTSGPSGPVPDPPTASTGTKFCPRSPTPTVSSNGTSAASGIVWAIEHQNQNNPANCNGAEVSGAALHAFKATDPTKELYNGRHGVFQTPIGEPTKFSTPAVFKGRVYVGTNTDVDVYGLCNGQCMP